MELISGFAKFVDAHTIAVGDHQYRDERIVIAVGGGAAKPKLEGIEYALTSKEIFLLPKFPKCFAVIGGGCFIGNEFAGIMCGLGAEVTQIIRDHIEILQCLLHNPYKIKKKKPRNARLFFN